MSKRETRPKVIDEAFLERLKRGLRGNAWVRARLPVWGRLHIDRQLPFLCVYRRVHDKPDPGTKQLLLGEAAYLLASGRPEQQAGISALVRTISQVQGEAFGAFLILELWSGPAPTEGGAKPSFRILAPNHQTPSLLLEKLANVLLRVRIGDYAPTVEVCYQDEWAPPGLAPLLHPSQHEESGCLHLGLEVPPLYRDARTGVVFPFELNGLRRDLGGALKRTFYTFSHTLTTHRPAHHHELGRHAMTSAVWKTDRALAKISDRFDVLLHVTPVNVEAAWNEFERCRHQRAPEFHYRPRPLNPARLKRALYAIPLERIEDPTLAHIFATKRDELDRQITMIADRCTTRFLAVSQQLYGGVDQELLSQARGLLEQLPPAEIRQEDNGRLDAEAFAARAQQQLDEYRRDHPDFTARVVVRDDVAGLLVSRGQLLVGPDVSMPEQRVAAAIAHEVGTHIVTHYNGYQQPFQQLHAGMANYEPLQEGLAVLSEYLVGGLDARRLRVLAGRVVAVDCLVKGADFIETFRQLHQTWGFDERQCFTITMRVFRGGGYTKDIVYLRGVLELLDYLADGHELAPLYLGKIALEHLPFIEELQWRKVLQPPPIRPHYLAFPGAEARLQRLRDRPSLLQLTEEVEA